MGSWVLILLLCSAVGVFAIPETFDMRYQPSALYLSHVAESSTICEAYSWSNRLAQTIANAYGLIRKQKIKVSARNIAECIGESLNDPCIETSLQNIESAISYLNRTQFILEECQRNRFLEGKGLFCRQNCDNGQRPTYKYPINITRESDVSEIIRKISQGNYTALAVVEVYDQMKYYSSDYEKNYAQSGEFYGYNLGEIVGWKNKGKTLTIRLGGSGWGFKGYANVPIVGSYITSMYTVFFDENRPRPQTNRTPQVVQQ